MQTGKIIKVSGPLVVAEGMENANMADVVRVGEQRLIGEILNMTGGTASIQVYEETSGLGPGTIVETTGAPLSVELGPGLIENIYDGIQRPLEEIMKIVGSNITRGVEVPSLSRLKVWDFTATAKAGDHVVAGDVIGTVQETSVVLHKIMVPNGLSGTIQDISSGSYKVDHTIATLKLDNGEIKELTMMQRWPVRVGRPYKKEISAYCTALLRAKSYRYHVSYCKRWDSRSAWSLWLRKNRSSASISKMGGCRYCRLHRMRRTW